MNYLGTKYFCGAQEGINLWFKVNEQKGILYSVTFNQSANIVLSTYSSLLHNYCLLDGQHLCSESTNPIKSRRSITSLRLPT